MAADLRFISYGKHWQAVWKDPAAAPAGLYDVLLRLPDAAPSLKNSPEYAIRFADDSGWEPAAGANRLRGAVLVDPGVKAAQFSGKQWFQ